MRKRHRTLSAAHLNAERMGLRQPFRPRDRPRRFPRKAGARQPAGTGFRRGRIKEDFRKSLIQEMFKIQI